MNDILTKLNAIETPLMIVGGVAKYLNGYIESYDKKWIDIAITSESIDAVKTLGTYLPIETSFPIELIKEQFIIKTNTWIIDVFVKDELIYEEWEIISGSKVQTPEADLVWHVELNNIVSNEHTSKKLVDRLSLYNF